MAGITFPERLTTARTQRNSSVSAGNHNSQIDTLEARDQFMLDFLSTFDAIPIGTIMPTTINFIDYGENKNMPDGWVWADGRELTASEYPKLYALVKDSMLEPDEYLAQVDPEYSTYVSQGNIGAFYNMVPCGYYVHTSGDKKADAERRYGHHHGVCQKIKEIQELHSDDSDIGERSVAQTGKGAQDEHDRSDDGSAALPAPDKFI